MNGPFYSLQVICLYSMRGVKSEPISIPDIFCISVMPPDMNMDRFMFMREKQKYKTVLSK